MLNELFGGKGFQAKAVPANEFESLPVGTYVAMVTANEIKQTKAGDGSYLELTFTVTEGSATGRKIWTRLNLKNKNETAVLIAQQQLASIVTACGKADDNIMDASEIHNIPITIVVRQTKDKTGTEIGKYLPYGSSGPQTPAAPRGAQSKVSPFAKK